MASTAKLTILFRLLKANHLGQTSSFGASIPTLLSGDHKIATTKSLYEEIKDRPTRRRTGNEIMDLACKGRARLNNDKAKETIKQTFENCKVCGRSFKKGRGMNIHLSRTNCRATLERRNRNCKSIKGSPQETHHSGSTNRINLPRQSSSSAQENTRCEESTRLQEQIETLSKTNQKSSTDKTKEEIKEEKTKEEEVLVIDDDIEQSIRTEVLTLPQCIDKKLRGFRKESEGKFVKEGNIVILHNPTDKSTKKIAPSKKDKKDRKKNIVTSLDMRQFIIRSGDTTRIQTNKMKSVVALQEATVEQEDTRQVVIEKCCKAEISQDQRVVVTDDQGDSRQVSVEKDSRKVEISQPQSDDWRVIVSNADEVGDGASLERSAHSEYERSIANQENSRQVIVKKRGGEDIRQVTEHLNTGDPDDIISHNFLQMRRSDYRTLTGVNHLNDKIIDEYLHLLQEKSKTENSLTVYAMPCHAYTWLDENFSMNFDKVSDWIKEDLTSKEIILIPINKMDHWTLVVYDTQKSTLTYYDSILGTRSSSNALKVMKRFLLQHLGKKGKTVTVKTTIDSKAPLQSNSYDCGVFVCENARKICRGEVANPKQEGMQNARKRIMKEIYLGTLINEDKPNMFDMVYITACIGKKKKSEKSPRRRLEPKKDKIEGKTLKGVMKEGNNMTGRKERLNWPKSNSPEWGRLDEDLSGLLRTLYAPAEIRAKTHPNVIYGMCKERFGVREQSSRETIKTGPSRRQKKCKELREEITVLKKAYTEAPQEEKKAIQELQGEKLKKLRLAKRAESLRHNRKKFSNNCKSFLTQPYQFARNLLSPKPKGEMESSKEEVEKFLKNAHADPNKGKPKDKCEDLKEYQTAEEDFDDNAPSFNEFVKKVRHARSKSAPGSNGIPYIVYKRCPKVAKLLWGYLKELWNKNVISDAWREAEGVFIPKEEGAKSVEKFRTISLLNVEGKIFFSLKSDRISNFVINNRYINTSIQKGGIPRVAGCIEHTAILSQLIKEAKKEKKNLVVTWLDIANAYGSIPHSVISAALEAAHIPEKTQDLISSYYNNVKIRFTTKNFTTEWQKVEKGIITGCTLSVILFSLSMSWLIESVQGVTKGPLTSSGQRQANSRLLMDDIATTTETVPQTNILLQKVSEKLKWAELEARAHKCRSLVIFKGQVQRRSLKLGGDTITPIQDKPVKYLGKEYKATLNESEQIQDVQRNLKIELKKIDKCKLPGRYKCWIVQHMLIPRLMWPLTIYNIPLTKVEELQKKITISLKKWMGIPKNFSTDCMYSKSSRLKLPFSSLIEEYKATKARNMVTFTESEDPCIREAEIDVDAGRKANTKAEVDEAKSRLKLQEIIGTTNKGTEGLGMRKGKYYSKSSSKEKRSMIVNTVKEKEEERRIVNITQLSQQGSQLRWEVPQRQIKPNDLIRMSDESLKFLIKAVHDLLPTPANKNRWFGTEEKCTLCGKDGTLNHILSGCSVARGQGRYTWRHDKVLKEVASGIETKIIENSNKKMEEKRRIQFVKAGEIGERQVFQPESYLSTARDWKLSVDLGKRLKIPIGVSATNLRPDITIVSGKTKQMGIVELTVPTEERIEISGELKRNKYEKIVNEGRQNGWRVRCWAVEVGCRGFPAVSMSSFLKDIGYPGGQRRKIIEKISTTAESASRTLWRASHFKKWGHHY